jgi:hypothetical protein
LLRHSSARRNRIRPGRRLLAILKTDAPPAEKADAFRELARIATGEAVPVLAPLLADEALSDMARFALEPIPDQAVDEALRDALGKSKVACSLECHQQRRRPQGSGGHWPAGQSSHRSGSPGDAGGGTRLGEFGGAAMPVLENALTTSSGAGRLAVCDSLAPLCRSGPAMMRL